ncbi:MULTISPECIES: ferritin-like domain-containing protein [unclassified Sphingomonas]|uniref:ferritin-like domain-containing protein n=1 Tax=unclassified Sphingomonas TaxID=196159 RepID=UPI00285EE400|nr:MULTISPECIES: ferritin-like domain-containing protein [unclassified Sphingomonas]MDR6116606.1 hypothetical protein [Sphingomonas sp. SORGH_AS_0789]MDR6149717.1 hypothetical protein [Sphingomonas sp. SORGH_AS_0742]
MEFSSQWMGDYAMDEPATPLTPAEKVLVEAINLTSNRDAVISRLKADLQTALTIELATIPIYLFTYYSLVRDQRSGESLNDTQIYANMAGGIIMSVAVEEMLHLSLTANILFAMGERPRIYRQAPSQYPTALPYHNPTGPAGPDGQKQVQIPLAKLGFEQLWHFLQIEYPEQWNTLPKDDNWDTIGQFYSYIRCLLSSKFVQDSDFRQGRAASAIQPYNYSPNNIDTAYPKAAFNPWLPAPPAPTPGWSDGVQGAVPATVFPDAEDSYVGAAPLVTIASVQDALDAIDTICDQGEGTPIANVGPGSDDDSSGMEQSHYVKFLRLQAQFADYAGTVEERAKQPPAPAAVIQPSVTQKQLIDAGVLVDFADNPVAADYPELYSDIANFCSACFQYMLVMIETIYLVPPDKQKLFFNEGLHRSMIWVMDKYIQTIRRLPIPTGIHAGTMMAPTFENVSLGTQADSFAGLTRFGNAARQAASELMNSMRCDKVRRDVDSLVALRPPSASGPDQDLCHTLQSVIDYITLAIGDGSKGSSMRLPDVRPYWIAEAPRPDDSSSTSDGAVTPPPATTPAPGVPVPSPYPYAGEPPFPKAIGAQPAGLPLHACMGLNSCKGADRFGLEGAPHGNVNQCAGQGYCATAVDHTCHVQNQCAGQGGCGLYGTGEEMNKPGANECRSLGSCATPINAERFSTNGPNQGKSVWLRARAVFEANWQQTRAALLEQQAQGLVTPDQVIPTVPGPPPAAFASTGPSYLWISADNVDRVNMTACGASGLSGAGGCS